MSTIVSAVDLWIPDSVSPAPRMTDKWETMLQAAASFINERRQAKIPDEAAYQDKLAQPAIQSWPGLPAGYRSKHGRTAEEIRAFFEGKIQDSFENWVTKLNQAFATVDGTVAKRFKEQVSASKGLWTSKVGKNVLRLTGDQIRGVGAATIASYWLIGEPMASGMLRPQDNGVKGGPYRICREEMVQDLQVALMQRLVRVGVTILATKFNPTIIATHNTTINNLLQGFVDPALGINPFVPGGASHLDFVKQGALLKLALQVSRV